MNEEQNLELEPERREGSRVVCEQFVSLTILVRPKMQKFQVEVVDLAPQGVGFLLDQPLIAGTVLALQRVLYVPGQSWIRSGKVMHSSPREDKWLIGCEVSPPFSGEELRAMRGKATADQAKS
jgi:hypothetical protein